MRRVAAGLIVLLSLSLIGATAPKDSAALRKQCAHAVKVKLGIKETGKVQDLAGVSGAIAMVDQCVANGGKLQ